MIDVSNHKEVFIITLRRPPVNAMDITVISDLSDCIADFAGQANPPPLVITGSGGAFSAGVDYKLFRSYSQRLKARLFNRINKMALALFKYPAATVSAINGHAVGGGLVLALTCDFRIAEKGEYQFALGEVHAGIPFPEVPLRIINRVLPPALRIRLALGGEAMSVSDACSFGIVSSVDHSSRLVAAAARKASRMNGLAGFQAIKRQLVDLEMSSWQALRPQGVANFPLMILENGNG